MNNWGLFELIRDQVTHQIFDVEEVNIDGIKYTVELEEDLETVDEGKYQFGGHIYRIKDSNGNTLFHMRHLFCQCGSYFSHQEREYEPCELVKRATKVIEYWKRV